MRFNQLKFGSGRGAAAKTMLAAALISSGLMVGLASTASAAGSDRLVIATAPSTTDASGAPLATQPVIELYNGSNVLDSGGTGTVTAAITSGGVSVSGGTATVSGGIATFSALALNALVSGSPYTLTFTDTAGDTSIQSAPIAVTVGAASQLVIATQPSSGAVSGTVLAQQPVVKVEDSGGNVVTTDSTTVTANFTAGGTSIAGNVKATSLGIATFTALALTAADGSYTLTFSDSGFAPTVLSSAVVISGVATQLVITTQPSTSEPSGVALLTQPVVTIEDASGHVVTTNTSTVTAAFTAPPVGSSVANATAVAVAGVATFSSLALTGSAGTYTLTFTDDSLTAIVSGNITISTGGASKLVIATEPSAAVPSGAALAQQPVVKIEDSGGNIVTSNTSTVTATFTSGGLTVANASVAAVAGVATFTNLTLNAPAGSYTLTFSDGSFAAATSTSITVGVGTAAQLVLTTQPSSSVANSVALAQQPVVKVEDSGGNIVTTNTSTVTASISSSSYVALHNTAVAIAGVATFAGLALNAPSGVYTLTFTDGSLATAISSTVTVSSGVATQLVITTQPSATDASGAALAQQPVVKVEDAAGNVIASDTSTVSVHITSGGVSVTSPTATAVAGVATFSGLSLNALAGSYTLTFIDGALTPAVSNSIAVGVGAARQLTITSQPSLFVVSGAVLAAQPVLKVEDSGGNVVAGVTTGNATASIYTGTGGAISAGATAPFVAGVATFSGLALTGVVGNQYSLLFSGDGLSVIDSAKIVVGTTQSVLSVTSVKGTYGRTLALTTSGGSGTGAVTFAVVNGTASGCRVSGSKLSFASTGTCVVTATKAGDATYASASSPATTVTITKLAKPASVKITFTSTKSALSTAARNSLISLSKKLTVKSSVTITGYAQGNLALAKSRATAVSKYLVDRIKVKVTFKWVTKTTLREVVVTTTAQ
jgi:hypothetical protein